MFFKKKSGIIKLNIFSKKANPSPPVGPLLGQKGLNILEFCKNFNSATSNFDSSFLLPVLIIYYSDKSYDFFIKKPTVYFYLKNILLKHSSSNEIIVDFYNILDIVRFKITDFNTCNIYSSIKIIVSSLSSIKNLKVLLNDF